VTFASLPFPTSLRSTGRASRANAYGAGCRAMSERLCANNCAKRTMPARMKSASSLRRRPRAGMSKNAIMEFAWIAERTTVENTDYARSFLSGIPSILAGLMTRGRAALLAPAIRMSNCEISLFGMSTIKSHSGRSRICRPSSASNISSCQISAHVASGVISANLRKRLRNGSASAACAVSGQKNPNANGQVGP
jgi:hypothetical protein